MTMIKNPVLPGFNPDPSILRVGRDYYIATSTFEWYPGVQIHHSRDLVHWRLIGRPLDRAALLDMTGESDSCGIWAPCLSHADGLFWLIYTDVKRFDGDVKDVYNYLTTAPSIDGPWSDPVLLNSSGFDPSLFHDDDGRKWLVNMIWDHRAGRNRFGGILLQEYSVAERKLVGPITNIYKGTPLGLVEGPHLYKRNGLYYLLTAEGGTGYDHAITLARSERIDGPYETHPENHVLTSRFDRTAPLQRAGHGSLVETENGEFIIAHLCGRPIKPSTGGSKGHNGPNRCSLGRETALQNVVWGEDGWLRLARGGLTPAPAFQPPADLEASPFPPEETRFDFDETRLPRPFQWLRTPRWERLFSLSERPGHLRLFGRESLGSWFEQSLVALRQTSHECMAETIVEFQPDSIQQAAGLIAYYNRHKFHYLAVTMNDDGSRGLVIVSCLGDWAGNALTYSLPSPISLPASGPVRMGLDIDGDELRFRYAIDDGAWIPVGPTLDAGLLSDEGGMGEHGNFTGNFIGMAAQDATGRATPADFDHFVYENR